MIKIRPIAGSVLCTGFEIDNICYTKWLNRFIFFVQLFCNYIFLAMYLIDQSFVLTGFFSGKDFMAGFVTGLITGRLTGFVTGLITGLAGRAIGLVTGRVTGCNGFVSGLVSGLV